MSLMRLLSVGRSLNEVKSVGRYHVPRQVGLPSFNFGKPAQKISSAPAPSPAEEKKPVTDPAKKKTSSGWLKSANPFAGAKAGAARTAVQAELTLEKIKVVRNDLSDADIEVVTQKELPRQSELKPYRKPNRPADVPSDDVLGTKAWNWLGLRLFGAAAKH